jgi:hypothetical protein
MTRYLISFDDGAMTFPEEELPDVAKAAHEVVQEAQNADVWVFGGGLESQKASIVATDGTVTDGPYPETKEVIGGFAVVDVPSREEALEWAARSPSPAAVHKRYGSSCPTRPSDRRRPATLEQDLPWPRSDHAGLHIDLNWGRGVVTLGSGVGQSPVLVPDRIPATTDRQWSDGQAHRGECARSSA